MSGDELVGDEIWRKIKERDDYMISNTGRIKRINVNFLTGINIQYITQDNKKTTISVTKLMAKYFPTLTKKNIQEVWKQIDERPGTFISNHKRIKVKTERILKSPAGSKGSRIPGFKKF